MNSYFSIDRESFPPKTSWDETGISNVTTLSIAVAKRVNLVDTCTMVDLPPVIMQAYNEKSFEYDFVHQILTNESQIWY